MRSLLKRMMAGMFAIALLFTSVALWKPVQVGAESITNAKPLVIKKGVFTAEEKGSRRPMSFHEPLPL